jgi:transposase InsO family protein
MRRFTSTAARSEGAQGVREHLGGFNRGIAAGLSFRHDHGSPYMSEDFQRELVFLGMTSSPSFVRGPQGNGIAERFVRAPKENLLWVRPFATVAELVEARVRSSDATTSSG